MDQINENKTIKVYELIDSNFIMRLILILFCFCIWFGDKLYQDTRNDKIEARQDSNDRTYSSLYSNIEFVRNKLLLTSQEMPIQVQNIFYASIPPIGSGNDSTNINIKKINKRKYNDTIRKLKNSDKIGIKK